MLLPLMKFRARELRKNLTDSEKTLWKELRLEQMGCKFRRQYPIGPYIVDFACPERMLIIELDGSHHLDGKQRDDRRTQWLESQGYKVLRFWNSEVSNELIAIKNVIYRHLTPHL